MDTGVSDSVLIGDADTVVEHTGSLLGVGEEGVNTGFGFSQIGERVGIAGVDELRE